MNDSSENALPPLRQERIEQMERAVLDAVRQEPRGQQLPGRTTARRRRRWVTGLGVAAAFLGGILIAPPLLSTVAPGSSGASADRPEMALSRDADAVSGTAPQLAEGAAGGADTAAGGAAAPVDADAGRDIITTAEMHLRVDDVSAAADVLSTLATQHGGYVEAKDIGLTGEERSGTVPDMPRDPGSGWLSIRIPAAELDAVMRSAGNGGEVLRSSVSRQDVTATAVDLRARVDASRASVQRLTELMTRSGSVADLITAESALNERQAQLESYEQELKRLDEQVAMSTISVQLTERSTASAADPARFGDGLLAGWNGLVTTLNALVVALGFLLPWLAIAAVLALVVWLVRRRRRT